MNRRKLAPDDALIVVDLQNDFCPGGALPVENGDRIVPVINEWIKAAHEQGACVVASRDWHPRDHVSFQERGGQWPVHCVQGTPGADFHPQLSLPNNAIVVSKGSDRNEDQYSAFGGTGLAELLRQNGVHRVWVGGLALDVCVKATALAAIDERFEVHLIRDATRPIDAESGLDAINEMVAAGCLIEEGRSDG